jgi:hypothetical protein
MRAAVDSADGVPLQHTLLAAGWAAVDPLSALDSGDSIDRMLALEDHARQAGLGIWQDLDVLPDKAADLAARIGTRQIVEGRVRRVSSNKRYVYLNFGVDWRTDFTVRLDQTMIESAAFDAADVDGRRLRVRGVLEEARGPLMTISHLKQIEFLP